jgi:uncharacterized repeat protein (TIGR02543 family)
MRTKLLFIISMFIVLVMMGCQTSLEQYTVTFDSLGGTSVTDQKVESGESLEIVTSTKEGYQFDGWYISSDLGNTLTEKWSFETSRVNQNWILYAKWVLIEYSISMNLDGGNADNPTFYTIEDEDIMINAPQKTGYEFLGWQLNDELEILESYIITSGSIGDITLTAVWVKNINDHNHDYYVTGNFAGWGNASGNPTYKMEGISKEDSRVSSIVHLLEGAEYIYIIEIVLPSTAAGWDVTYKIDCTVTVFDGNLTVKVIQTDAGDDIPNFWAQNPESGAITNLTPETLYIPPFVEENVDQAGTWNDNPVARAAGTYYLVFVIFQGTKAMALILK